MGSSVTSETISTVGLVGLGRMGSNMARRWKRGGLTPIVWDRDATSREAVEAEGIEVAASLEDLIRRLPRPRVVWLMVPAAVTAGLADQVAGLLESGDIVVDGGNSNYRHAVDRAEVLRERGVFHVDVGTSGGVHGLERGYCLMIGGDTSPVVALDRVFSALAPGEDGVPRTVGRSGEFAREERGYLHCGPPGAGHFVKMVHNAIEYGLMAAYAEGFNLLARAGAGKKDVPADAETAPPAEAKYHSYDFEVEKIAELWRRGSVIPSWLLDLTAEALLESPRLEGFAGRVSDSGEGRWASQVGIELGVPLHVLSAALFDRFQSQGRADFASKVLSAMRLGFGGHHEKK